MSLKSLIVLPGYSQKNKAWLEETGERVKDFATPVLFYWPHWETETSDPNWIQNEVDKLHEKTAYQSSNIIAKSVGSLVMVTTLEQYPQAFNHIIICGLPLNDLDENDKKHYKVLKDIPTNQILVIQNDQDNHGTYADVRAFLDSIECQHIQMVSHPADNHEYPYWNDFREFFTKQA